MKNQELETIADEIHQWHVTSFPKETNESLLLALGEEVGELMRAEAKQFAGVRGTYEEWQLEKAKEAGDVLITIIEYAVQTSNRNIVLDEIVSPCELELQKTAHHALLNVGMYVGKLMGVFHDTGYYDYYQSEQWNLQCIVTALYDYLNFNEMDLMTVLRDRWNTIKQRNYVLNPFDGGREHEV